MQANFYVSHQYTNYQHLQKMWNEGHEIAVHSVRWVEVLFLIKKFADEIKSQQLLQLAMTLLQCFRHNK